MPHWYPTSCPLLLYLDLLLHQPHVATIVLAVLAHIDLTWTTRDTHGHIPPAALYARVKFLAHDHLRSIFP
jgi:hypothetical protein